VSGEAFALESMGGGGTPFKILDTMIKPRASCGSTISSIMAAERAHVSLKSTEDVGRVIVEVYEPAKRGMGTDEVNWRPETRETADHSIPYVVAAALMSNADFTKAYESVPVGHSTRVEVVTTSGERHVGEVNSIKGDTRDPMTDGEIEDKFRNNTRDILSSERARVIMDRLWHLEEMEDVAEIPPALVL
jgi:2-methylcitrate dehydratase